MPEVQDVFEQYSAAYRQNHKLSLTQYKAMNAIQSCRTSRLGGHMDKCPSCGYEKPSYNSCRNRHCPKCQTFSKERWIDAQKADLLDIGYFHVVFTLPQELNSLIYRNQKDCYNLLFRCVAETLQELAGDKSIWVHQSDTPQSCIPGGRTSAFILTFTVSFHPAG